MNLIKCSVCILTFNSGKTLEKTLQNLKNFGEVVICDGGSTDQTLLLAKEYGCTIIAQDGKFKNKEGKIIDFSGVRNQCIEVAKYNWIFMLDSDEYFEEGLESEVRSVVSDYEIGCRVYNVPRKYIYKKKIVEHSPYYPRNYQVRFFARNVVDGYVKPIHEKIKIKQGCAVGLMRNPLYVPLSADVRSVIKKYNYYLSLEEERHKNEKSFGKWLKNTLYRTLRSTIGVSARYVKSLFCRGVKHPFRHFILDMLYNIKLIYITGKKFLFFMRKYK